MGEDLPVLFETLSAESFLEYAFLRWVLTPALAPSARPYVVAQEPIVAGQHTYRVDYALHGTLTRIAIELDGFAYHGSRDAFTHDRLRQNDLQALGWRMLRFSYDAIRTDTARCIAQIQAMCRVDPGLAPHVIARPVIAIPEMSPDPLSALRPAPRMVSYGAISMTMSYPAVVSPAASQQAVSPNYAPAQLPHSFERLRGRLDLRPLRRCQLEAFAALANYYRAGGRHAACVMSVGAGKTALGVAAALAFTRQRALVVTPGNVVRGAFDRALDPQAVGNALYGLPGGPLIPGSAPPRVLTLDRSDGAISHVERQALLDADILVTNFQSLGTGAAPDDVLAKLLPDDVDLLVVDEAHIAAADSYQRLFRHFADARTLLMSACFQRLDGRPIDADVVYRYRLIDSIADGNAKTLRIQRFTPVSHDTTYEIIHPDGRKTQIVGRDALLALLADERQLARVTAVSDIPIRHVMAIVREALARQATLLHPVKPRVLFSALGERHAEQLAEIATACGIPTAYLHHSMPEARIRAIRARYEQDSGDLQGIVQLKMLGQGYDFPPITVVVPMRPYGSFGEFYQFIGRGIRAIQYPALRGRVSPQQQVLDIVYHAELGLDSFIEAIYRENDMDPQRIERSELDILDVTGLDHDTASGLGHPLQASTSEFAPGRAGLWETYVLFERGTIERRVVHDSERIEQRRSEREHEALAQRYAAYAAKSAHPLPFEEYVRIMSELRE